MGALISSTLATTILIKTYKLITIYMFVIKTDYIYYGKINDDHVCLYIIYVCYVSSLLQYIATNLLSCIYCKTRLFPYVFIYIILDDTIFFLLLECADIMKYKFDVRTIGTLYLFFGIPSCFLKKIISS